MVYFSDWKLNSSNKMKILWMKMRKLRSRRQSWLFFHNPNSSRKHFATAGRFKIVKKFQHHSQIFFPTCLFEHAVDDLFRKAFKSNEFVNFICPKNDIVYSQIKVKTCWKSNSLKTFSCNVCIIYWKILYL